MFLPPRSRAARPLLRWPFAAASSPESHNHTDHIMMRFESVLPRYLACNPTNRQPAASKEPVVDSALPRRAHTYSEQGVIAAPRVRRQCWSGRLRRTGAGRSAYVPPATPPARSGAELTPSLEQLRDVPGAMFRRRRSLRHARSCSGQSSMKASLKSGELQPCKSVRPHLSVALLCSGSSLSVL